MSHSSVSSIYSLAQDHYYAGQLQESHELLYQALILFPSVAEVLQFLAVVAHARKEYESALRSINRAIRIDPTNPHFYQNAGPIYKALGYFDDAQIAIRRSLLLAPDNAANYNNLGTLLHGHGRFSGAVACFDRARAIDARDPVVEYNAGGAYTDWGRLDDAVRCLGRALDLREDYSDAYNRLGKVYRLKKQLGLAVRCHKFAIALKPDDPVFYSNLAGIHKLHAQSALAISLYQRSLCIDPNSSGTYSNMLFATQYSAELSSHEIAAAHRLFGMRFETPLRQFWRLHANVPDSERPLKIGYVSADFNHHATSYFIEPVLVRHDIAHLDVYCYYNNTLQDSVTDRLRDAVGHWVPCHSMSDEQLSRRIREDRIDILVDLSGHTAGNRLLVFARKPAPVQVTWLGYFGTTGLTSMDYRLTDPHMDPPDISESQHAEKLLRLPHFAPLQPLDQSPPVNRLPALASGKLTLASLNNSAKLNAQVVHLWSRILKRLPDARLMLCNIGDNETGLLIAKLFAKENIGIDRLFIQPWLSMADYLTLHHEIDLALDPFPYNGGATTNHSLWMGVPVVTLEGNRPVSRIGSSLMNWVGLKQFVTRSEEEYLMCVLHLAENLWELEDIRQGLRNRLVSNTDVSADAITRSVELAYRKIWRDWCSTRRLGLANDCSAEQF